MAANHDHRRTYEDFEPPVEWFEEDGCTILTIYLPGFSKEGIQVQVSSTRKLRISGQRPYRNNTWQRFHKEFQISSNCEASEITAKFKGGILYIRQPWRELEESKPPEVEQPSVGEKQPAADSEANNGKQRAGSPDDRKKSTVAGEGKVLEAKSYEEREETQERANISNKIITSRAGRLKEVIPGILVKVMLPILLAGLLFLCAKRVSQAILFVGVGEPPVPQ